MQRIHILYNTDYDAELTRGGVDVSSVAHSAAALARALGDRGYTVELVGIHGRDVCQVLSRVREARPDLVFNLCESMAGDPRNEPTFAGLLDLFQIPYTGADLLTLASCLYKRRTKEVLEASHIATPPYLMLDDAAALADRALDALDYPWFVKLGHEDASLGITEHNLVRDAAALRARTRALLGEFRQPVLAERYIEGREINVTLLAGEGSGVRVLPLHEIDFAAMPSGRPRIVSYAAKWDEEHVDYAGTKPVPLRGASPELVASIEATAIAAWHALGLRDYGRVDLRVDAAGQPWVIDVNPNPDISPDAGVVRAAMVAGISYAELVETIALAAWRRYRRMFSPTA